jgi:hypothetical protein
VYPPLVAKQRLGKNPLIVARQWLGKNPPVVGRQRLGRNVTAVTNTHATAEELLDASFSMRPVSSQNFLLTTVICGETFNDAVSIVAISGDAGVMPNAEKWNDNWQGKPKYSEKICATAT